MWFFLMVLFRPALRLSSAAATFFTPPVLHMPSLLSVILDKRRSFTATSFMKNVNVNLNDVHDAFYLRVYQRLVKRCKVSVPFDGKTRAVVYDSSFEMNLKMASLKLMRITVA